MYWLIIPFWKKTFDSIGYTYIIPENLLNKVKKWMVVEFFLKEEITYWVIYDFVDKISFDKTKLKEIIWIKSEFILLSWYRIELIKYISNNYFTAIHNSLWVFLPANLKKKIITDKLSFKDINLKYNNDFIINLSNDQNEAYNNIKKYNKSLLFWVTWSWKTQIYIKLIQDQLKLSKQSLLLIPEIILTTQISDTIKHFFWKDVLIINSTITEATKTKYFWLINSWEAKVIIWTRSSIFYPYCNLGLIIIDEEHDWSYISDQSPRYNTIDIAEKITELNWNKLLLWSGTPSIKNMYKAINSKEYNLVSLFKKYKKTDT